jgi:hypothetical protein
VLVYGMGQVWRKIVSRPKNEDIGKPLRDRRVPVMVSQDEYAALEGAAVNMGVGVSTYMRLKALGATKAPRSNPPKRRGPDTARHADTACLGVACGVAG